MLLSFTRLFVFLLLLFFASGLEASPSSKVHPHSKYERRELRKIKKSKLTITLKNGYSYTGILVLARENGIALWVNLSDTSFRSIRRREWEYLQPETIRSISVKNNRIIWQAAGGVLIGAALGYVFDTNQSGNWKYFAGAAMAGGIAGAAFSGRPPFSEEIDGKMEVYLKQLDKLKGMVYKY